MNEQFTTLLPTSSPAEVIAMMVPVTFDKAQLVSMLSHKGGADNLTAAQTYMTDISMRRTDLAQRYSDDVAHEMMALLSFDKDQLVSIVSHDGGRDNLAAARSYVTDQLAEFTELTKDGFEPELAQALMVFNINKQDLVETVSHPNGVQRLAEKKNDIWKI
jgi:hypothetical protein